MNVFDYPSFSINITCILNIFNIVQNQVQFQFDLFLFFCAYQLFPIRFKLIILKPDPSNAPK